MDGEELAELILGRQPIDWLEVSAVELIRAVEVLNLDPYDALKLADFILLRWLPLETDTEDTDLLYTLEYFRTREVELALAAREEEVATLKLLANQ